LLRPYFMVSTEDFIKYALVFIMTPEWCYF